MNSRSTAIVLIEFQNEFASEGGIIFPQVQAMMEKTNMLANTVKTVKDARAKGVAIIHVPIIFTDDYHELSRHPFGVLKGAVEGKTCRRGSWGAQFIDLLTPQPGDHVVEGKRSICAFNTTNLDFILRSQEITHVAVAGFLTNCCVESTLRNGYDKGYRTIALTDCMTANCEIDHVHAITKHFPMFCQPMSHIEFLRSLTT
jgi:ureidoacrylate peracid hydrolase